MEVPFWRRLMNESLDLEPIKARDRDWTDLIPGTPLHDRRVLLAEVEGLRDACGLVVRTLERTLQAYADLTDLDTDDDEIIYGSIRRRLAEVESLRDKLARQAEQITAIRELHWRAQLLPAGNRDPELTCGECGDDWPCPTIRALDGAS
jgi:hypothetical protein